MAKPRKIIIPIGLAKTNKSESGLSPHFKNGKKRVYFSTELDKELVEASVTDKQDIIIGLGLFLLSIALKLPGLSDPSVVIFDESHTVNHIKNYIIGEYFNDITPPLSTLIYTIVSYLTGYRGDADILKPSDSYIGTNVPYVALRFFTMFVSSLTLPLFYSTLRAVGVRKIVASGVSLLLILEPSIVLHSRIFQPDTFFLFGLSLVVYSLKKFEISKSFTKDWFRYLFLTGIGLGLTVSTKWVGLATIFWILSLTVYKLWFIFGDVELSDCTVAKHTAFRISAYTLVPAFIYLVTFAIHIILLPNYHRDAALLTSDFQRTLIGNDIASIPKYVTFGSTITLRHSDSMGGYLHSHPYHYKSGSKNQQVTVFDYKDFNNEWVIEAVKDEDKNRQDLRVQAGQEIRLRHKNTGGVLRVDDFKPPISEQEYDFEVSVFGNHSYPGNKTDEFWINWDHDNSDDGKLLKAFETQISLRNKEKACTILSHDLKLPEWGFNQQEVICIQSPTVSRSLFTIETVKYPKDLDLSSTPYLKEVVPKRDPSFLSKFIELNRKMYRIFKSIDPTKNKNTSSAYKWPLLATGVKYLTRETSQIFVIGNPLNFWLVAVLIPTFIIVKALDLVKTDYLIQSINFKEQGLTFVTGWIAHWIPYVLFEGEWFAHYYIPSLYFGILLIGVTFEFIYFKNETLGQGVLVVSILFGYYLYSQLTPLVFGTEWTQEACLNAKWSDSWGFVCDIYK